MQYLLLEDALNDMAVIQTTFETLDHLPTDDSIREEILDVVFDARSNLIYRFRDLYDGLQANLADYQLDYEKFRACALRMMTRGYPNRSLNRWMKTTAFDEGEMLYFYKSEGLEAAEEVGQMPAHPFTVRLFNDVLKSIQDNANYADGQMFRQKVFQKYIAVLFLYYAAGDPMFYGL